MPANTPRLDDLESQAYFQYIVNQSVDSLADATEGDVGTGTITLEPGKYLLEYGARVRLTTTATPTSAICLLYVRDASDNAIAGVSVGLPAIYASGDWRSSMNTMEEITVASTITIRLRANIDVTGGTVSTRSVQLGFIKATRIVEE